jgi:hypothetical protein
MGAFLTEIAMEVIKRKTLIFVVVCVAGVCAKARVITVDDDGPADFNNIQAAIDFASDGDTVIVQAGLYQKSINFLGKNITLTSANPSNPNVVVSTTVDGSVQFSGTEDANCMLIGFNINSYIHGSSLGTPSTHATISYCVLQGNSVYGGTVVAFCDGVISNCLIADNISSEGSLVIGPAILWCHGSIENSTIVNNYCGGGLEVLWDGGHTRIENCIIYGNEGYQIFTPIDATVDIQYSNIEGGWNEIVEAANVNWGSGNIDTDPCFVRVGYWDFNEPWTFFEGDYHLQSAAGRWDPNTSGWVTDANTSVCIDAGNPGCSLGSEWSAANNVRINMGAYGGTATASKSPGDWRSIGDLTNDWAVDFNDLAVFVDYWLESGDCVPSDLDRDGSVDFADFDILGQSLLW